MALRRSLDEPELDEAPALVATGMTADEYFAGPETLQPHNLIEGLLYVSPFPFWKHQRIVLCLTIATEAFAVEHGGATILSPMDCRLADNTVVQPDIGYIAPGREHIIQDHVMGAPDLVIEVLSRGTRRFDRTKKLDAYGRNGVREAWIVDPETESVTLFFGDGERWLEETSVLFGDAVPSRVIDIGDAGLGALRQRDA